jgi:hypothetical protein
MSFDVNKKVIEDSECLDFVLALLKNGIAEDSEIGEDFIRVEQLGVTIRPKVSEIRHTEDKCMVHIQYAIEQELFDEPVLEGLAGIGKTLKGAVALSVYNFITIALCGMRKCVHKNYMTEFKSEFQGKEHIWHVSDSCASVLNDKADDPENEELQKYWEVWEVLKNYMPKFVGGKKTYWLNIYCAKREDGVTIGEVRLNNRPCRELSNIFSEAAQNFPDDGGLKSLKRFYYITQDDSTYEPYPLTMQEVEEATYQTLSILEECVKEERYHEYHKKVREAVSDKFLAMELLAFIPEICARGAYSDVGYAEYIGIRKPSDKEMELVSLSQFTSYYWIEKILVKALTTGKMSRDLYMTCISLSGTFRAVGELKKKSPDQDLSQADLCFAIEVSDDYVVR